MGIVDCVTMVGVVLLCTGIGLYYSFKKKGDQEKNLEDYLLAGRNMAIVPAAFSILATKLSAVSMAGGVGESYNYGPQMSLIFVGYFFGQIITTQCIIPVLRQDKYVSVYEYLERRFDRSIRMTFSLLYVVGHLIYAGIVLYVPAASVTAVSGVPFEITILVAGVTCTLYCVLGGYKAVVFTDMVQTFVMFLCFILVIVQGTILIGSPAKVWEESVQSGFSTTFSLTENEGTRYSVWAILATGVYTSLRDMGVGQAGVQRLLSIRTTRGAQISAMVSAVLGLIFMCLLWASSTVVYVYFRDCDPIQRRNVTGVQNADQIFVYSIVKFMGDIPGLSGIAISGIISGAISSFSSFINAFAAITVEDHLSVFTPSLVANENRKLVICKILTGVYGVLSMLFAFLVPYLGGVIKTTFSTVSVISGPLAGVLLMGFFCKRYGKKACIFSLTLSIGFCLCLQIGSQMANVKYPQLSLTTESCDETGNQTFSLLSTENFNDIKKEKVFPLFLISFMWFGPIGIVLCMAIGYLSTFIFDYEYVNPILLHPMVVDKHETSREIVVALSVKQYEDEDNKEQNTFI